MKSSGTDAVPTVAVDLCATTADPELELLDRLATLDPALQLHVLAPYSRSPRQLRTRDTYSVTTGVSDLLTRLSQAPPDLVHVPMAGRHPDDYAALAAASRSVLGIRDRDLELVSTTTRLRQRSLIHGCGPWASRIVVDSEFRADRMCHDFGLPPSALTCIPPGLDLAAWGCASERLLDWFRRRHDLGQSYVLGVADGPTTIDWTQMVEAFERFAQDQEMLFVILEPVRLGPLPSKRSEALTRRLRVLDGLLAEEWPLLLQGAAAVAVLNRTERYPLRAIEAMASGVPVLGHLTASHHEALGDAALLVETLEQELDLHLQGLASTRTDWIDAGRTRAARHCIDKTAQRTLDVYLEVLAGPPLPARRLPATVALLFPDELSGLTAALDAVDAAPTRSDLLLIEGPPSTPAGTPFDLDEACLWHELELLAEAAVAADGSTYVIDLGATSADDVGGRERLRAQFAPDNEALLSRAGTAEVPLGWSRHLADVFSGRSEDGDALTIPSAHVCSASPRNNYVGMRLADRTLPGFPGTLRTVWLGRPSGLVPWSFTAPPLKSLAANALTEAAFGDGYALILIDGAGAEIGWLDFIVRHFAARGQVQPVVTVSPATLLGSVRTHPDLGVGTLGGVVLDAGPGLGDAISLLRQHRVRFCLRAELSNEREDPAATSRQISELRAAEPDGVLLYSRPQPKGALYESDAMRWRERTPLPLHAPGRHEVLLAAARLSREPPGPGGLAAELLAAAIEIGRLRPRVGPDQWAAHHAHCRRQQRDQATEHQAQVAALQAYIARLERTLEDVLIKEAGTP